MIVKRSRSKKAVPIPAVLAITAGSAMSQTTGPNTQQTPYVVPVAPGVQTISIASNGPSADALGVPFSPSFVGDETYPGASGGVYRLAGIPDGMGAFDNGDSTFTLLVNHELGSSAGADRAHGSIGAFVSKWTIKKDVNDLQVIGGEDLIKSVLTWDKTTGAYNAAGTTAFNRFCSADLPAVTAFFNPTTGLGTTQRIYMTGEETGPSSSSPANDYGRAFGTIVTGPNAGTAYELPRLGRLSYENVLANPLAQDKTVVIGMDDASRRFTSEGAGSAADPEGPSELWVYVGEKQATGSEIEKAGLTNGTLYGIKVARAADENSFASGASFSTVSFGNVENTTGLTQQSDAQAAGLTEFRRIEDGAWDPANPNDFYFLTTDTLTSGGGTSRLWRLRFNDASDPTAGGAIERLLDGTEGQEMMDNMTLVNGLDGRTRLLIQEDPGGTARSARILMYDVTTDSLIEIAKHDPARFGESPAPSPTPPFNNNEESSGIIPAWDLLGPGWFLMDVQAHYRALSGGIAAFDFDGDGSITGADTAIATELVEGGQLLAMYVPQSVPEPATLAVLGGLGGLLLKSRCRRSA